MVVQMHHFNVKDPHRHFSHATLQPIFSVSEIKGVPSNVSSYAGKGVRLGALKRVFQYISLSLSHLSLPPFLLSELHQSTHHTTKHFCSPLLQY